ncbi:hypothetical protein BC936DRAFT_141213 [Jimgerdemannia flammicorona]|uniref:Uncharacterized protein n=1 Tax=Jimgerdemannia flammicorona TaxID=994334 RepID=A0A433DG91_9FUNG|nr:hypothetical protein BC936DRAFT_141213 [Jimgerdemannia flammicorona]
MTTVTCFTKLLLLPATRCGHHVFLPSSLVTMTLIGLPSSASNNELEMNLRRTITLTDEHVLTEPK